MERKPSIHAGSRGRGQHVCINYVKQVDAQMRRYAIRAEVVQRAGLARRVVQLVPLGVVKG